MLDFQVPRITAEEIEDNKGSFTVEPLDRGFGYTFGNSLRRVLLSSLVGAAVTSVRIEGVAHEFSTIKGVTEDVEDDRGQLPRASVSVPFSRAHCETKASRCGISIWAAAWGFCDEDAGDRSRRVRRARWSRSCGRAG